ncbi:MAG: NAD(P)/FAD-dependent oxidoreductase, partial [Geminicoccaceae bacterium]
TDAGAGILSARPDVAAEDPCERFAAQAVRYYPQLIERLAAEGAGDTGYAVCGSLTVAVSDDELVALEQVRAGLGRSPSAREACTELSPEQARDLFPPLAPVRGAIHCARDARVDGRLLAGALRQVALAHGLRVREAEVSDLSIDHGAVRGVAIDGEVVPAGHVVIAAGAWSKSLGERIGVAIPVAPQRGQIAHLELPDTDTAGWPIVRAFRDHYMVPWPGRVVVGATRESVGFAPRTTLAGIMEVLSEAARVAPGLRDASLAEMRVGLRPASPDGLPVLGPAPGLANLHLATGHGAVGLQLGPFSGKVIADAIIRGDPGVDLAPFAPDRWR